MELKIKNNYKDPDSETSGSIDTTDNEDGSIPW